MLPPVWPVPLPEAESVPRVEHGAGAGFLALVGRDVARHGVAALGVEDDLAVLAAASALAWMTPLLLTRLSTTLRAAAAVSVTVPPLALIVPLLLTICC